ncbi:MAG: AbrB/MazE/SpoVT family DNA-binding domain-containing protein [Spirochaetes bacterium]|nr:AbrB/MazE/SpoVT family DNA-binding domain-containing protein [Spirochaetota bacterium]MBN2770844.1 AbrB/MazE/SpoVT family DNA-binding domain-containing protein [Spirochaetota bacterium]
MNTAKIFTTGRSQAVRLPKEYRFTTESVFVKKIDDMVILIPKEKVWDNFSKSLEKFPDNFMSDRVQPDLKSRDNIE